MLAGKEINRAGNGSKDKGFIRASCEFSFKKDL